jgi:hypothetical protein
MRRKYKNARWWHGGSGAGTADSTFELDSGAWIEKQPDESTAEWVTGAGGAIPNSPRSWHFHFVNEAIGRMAQLPPSDPLHIDEATSRYAANLVGLMRNTFEIDPPKIFPQDAEALVMTWEEGEFTKLLTIAGEEVSLLDMHNPSQLRCYHDVADGPEAITTLVPLLIQTALPRTSSQED